MEIKQAKFLVSSSRVSQCPLPDKPEYAFVGRSNVGKSSLLNMLAGRKSLAKTSATPGKTQLINHFLMNQSWYLVDLPGYGYARAPKAEIHRWSRLLERYILDRTNLCCLFLLVDIRHEAKASDLDFMTWLGGKQIPFALVFTKSDKLKPSEADEAINRYRNQLSEIWDPLPTLFVTSSVNAGGRMEILDFIGEVNATWTSLQPGARKKK